MPNSSHETTGRDGAPLPIAEALVKNLEATEDVKKAADDLAVVHAVLDSRLAKGGGKDDDVERAVAETSEVEKRLADTAERLDEVNESLARGKSGGGQ